MKKTLSEMKAMKLHEHVALTEFVSVMRVPGGWVYSEYTTDVNASTVALVFVPETSAK